MGNWAGGFAQSFGGVCSKYSRKNRRTFAPAERIVEGNKIRLGL
jgi:hypothetical protein